MTTDVESILKQAKIVEQATTSRVATAAPVGYDGALIEIECDTSNGLPGITIVGLGSKAIDEAKERIRSAINNSKLTMPKKRITLNLAPADLPKDGSGYDVPLAVAILLVSKQVPRQAVKETLFIGELALDGRLRPTKGMITAAEVAQRNGFKRVVVPRQGCEYAALIEGIEVIAIDTLRELYRYLCGEQDIASSKPSRRDKSVSYSVDFKDITGQQLAKRALEIAAAGGHNVLMTGPPGTGKTLLAQAMVSILPPLETKEAIEVSKLQNLVHSGVEPTRNRPFRSPHHSTSHVALIGGGRNATPGEVSLAHNGVLFLDEIPEFGRQALESLRQPLEDNKVTVARAERTVQYPASFMLIATSNPCPCGYFGDQQKACECSPSALFNYQRKLSGPLLDRIDMVVRVERVDHDKLLQIGDGETSQRIAGRVAEARKRQQTRNNQLNESLTTKQLRAFSIEEDAKGLLDTAAERLKLSPRAYIRCIKVARTIADLEDAADISKNHISEALHYRGDFDATGA